MRQLGLAALAFHDAKNSLPPGLTQESVGGQAQGHSVFYFLLPFIEEKGVFDKMDASVPGNNISTVAGTGAATSLPTLVCPTDIFAAGNPYEAADGNRFGVTSYRANGGSRPLAGPEATNDGTFMATGSRARKSATAPPGQLVRLKHITDGAAKTLLFAESTHIDDNFDTFSAVGFNNSSTINRWSRWYPGGDDTGLWHIMCGAFAPVKYETPFGYGESDAPASATDWAIHRDRRLGAIGSLHRKGANASFADGSVRLLDERMEKAILELICKRADGQFITDLP